MNNGYQNFKSALAFFFLFFLRGTSIGNGQQGISYNVFGLGEVAEPECLIELQNFKIKNEC